MRTSPFAHITQVEIDPPRNQKELSMPSSRIRAASLAVLLTLGAGALLFAEGTEPVASGKKVNINTATPAELAYLPRLGAKKERLETIPGSVPNTLEFPSGCTFHPRCFLTKQRAQETDAKETVEIDTGAEKFRVLKRCAAEMPALREIEKGHWCSCWESHGYAEGKETDPSAP
jgi:oligopeptide/dipeptide ABC transporter ATP-binding protein